MRPETSEALARLVSIYVALIERTGIDINDANINRIMTDPFAACESLNELAVKVGALDAEADAVIAAIYESMDAADARSAADEACLTMAASAWETTHVERPVPEPEPEPEPQAADEPKDAEVPDEARTSPSAVAAPRPRRPRARMPPKPPTARAPGNRSRVPRRRPPSTQAGPPLARQDQGRRKDMDRPDREGRPGQEEPREEG